MRSPAPPSRFEVRTVLKRDIFSEVAVGVFLSDPLRPVIYRRVSHAPLWARPLAWHLARREIAALKVLEGLERMPQLVAVDRTGLYRSWIEGVPLHVAKPYGDERYFQDAKRLLRQMRRRHLTHNDLAKPQNWLVTPDGRAALIDMQLATAFRSPTRLFRLMAREDLRHLLKQKRSFCKSALTPREKRLLAEKSLPARLWLRTGKPVYNLVTRGVFGWSDGEGTRDRMDHEGPAIRARLLADGEVSDVMLSLFPNPRKKGVGLYAYVEAVAGADRAELERRLQADAGPRPDLLQVVERIPRDAHGRPREDLLRLVAINQLDRIETLAGDEDTLALTRSIADARRNLTDRRLR